MNTETPVITATPYVPPQMTIVPLRASGMLCVSPGLRGGDVYQNALEEDVLDFGTSNSDESQSIRNGRFDDWSENDNHFF